MELHESLYALGLQLGREVFDDPESFRGALDDFLDEDAASTGDINLLVDAVRLGAFAQMASMLDSGAQPSAAVEEAGQRLARDRGSADVSGAQWACAVLGFAIGKVPEGEVRRHRTQHANPHSVPPQPETRMPGGYAPTGPASPGYPVPTAAPAPPAPTQYPGAPVGDAATMTGPPPVASQGGGFSAGPGAAPTGFVGGPGGPSVPGGPGAPGPGGWQQPQKKRKTWPIIVGAAAAVAVIAGGGIAVLASGGDDDPKPKADPKKDEPTVSLELPDVDERYSGLATSVTQGVEECTAGEPGDGVTEVLECGFANGTLTLTTYESGSDLNAGRGETVNTDPATRFSKTDEGVIFSVDNSSAVAVATESGLYWDSNESLQSAHYVGSSDSVSIDLLTDQYDAAGGVLTYPTAPEDPGMIALAEEFIDLKKCNRIQTINPGEIEESHCDAPGDVYIFMGKFQKPRDFKNYRRDKLQQGADQGSTLRTWNFGGGEREGALAEFLNGSGSAVRYWDRQDCLCYMEAYLDSGDQVKLTDWWTNA